MQMSSKRALKKKKQKMEVPQVEKQASMTNCKKMGNKAASSAGATRSTVTDDLDFLLQGEDLQDLEKCHHKILVSINH